MNFIEHVKARVDIVTVVSARVALTDRKGRLFGKCPFHGGENEDFEVVPRHRAYRCFGCAAFGDAIGFVVKTEGVTVPDAARLLAERNNIPIPADATI